MALTTQHGNTTTLAFDQIVVDLIQSWLAKEPNRSSRLLSKLSGYRLNTLLDLKNGKTTTLVQETHKLVNLLCVIENTEPAVITKKYSAYLNEIERLSPNSKAAKVDQDLSTNSQFSQIFAEAMKNPIALAIYTASLGDKGVTVAEISENYGRNGVMVADELCEKNIILKNNSSLFAINKHYVHIEREHIKGMIPALNSFYDPAHSGQDRNYTAFRVDKVNVRALKMLHMEFAAFHGRMNDILGDERSKGDNPFYWFAQLDTFIDKLK